MIKEKIVKKTKLILITALCTLFVSITAFGAENIPSAVKRNIKSAVSVCAVNGFGETTVTGTAVDNMHVITSLKALDGNDGNITVSYRDEKTKAMILAEDAEYDIAVLYLENELKSVKPVKFINKTVKDNSEIYIVNRNAAENEENISSGLINSRGILSAAELMPVEVYILNVPTSRDDIGAILCTAGGGIAGLCYYDGNTESSKAIMSTDICTILKNNDIKYKKYSLIPKIILFILLAAAVCVIIWLLRRRAKAERPVLEGLTGDFSGRRMPLTKENISIGRDAKCCQVVILNDPKVSRCHCSIRYDTERDMFVLTDLSSTHGTYLADGKKLEANVPVYLSAGASFNIGDGSSSFRVTRGEAE